MGLSTFAERGRDKKVWETRNTRGLRSHTHCPLVARNLKEPVPRQSVLVPHVQLVELRHLDVQHFVLSCLGRLSVQIRYHTLNYSSVFTPCRVPFTNRVRVEPRFLNHKTGLL